MTNHVEINNITNKMKFLFLLKFETLTKMYASIKNFRDQITENSYLDLRSHTKQLLQLDL